jgi:hypothetical protein
MNQSLITRDARGNIIERYTAEPMGGAMGSAMGGEFRFGSSEVHFRAFRAEKDASGRYHCVRDDVLTGTVEQLQRAAALAAGEPNPTQEFVNQLVKEAHDAKEEAKSKDAHIVKLSQELSQALQNNRLGMEELRKYHDENLQLKSKISELEGKIAAGVSAPPPSPFGMAAPSPYAGAAAFGGPAAGGAAAFGGPAFGGPAAGGAAAFGGPAFGGPAPSPAVAPADSQPSMFGSLLKFIGDINPGDGRSSSDSRSSSRASSAIRRASMGVRHNTAFATPKPRKARASSPPQNDGSRPGSVFDRFMIPSNRNL